MAPNGACKQRSIAHHDRCADADGADAVVMQEGCEVLDDGRILVKTLPTVGNNIRRRGEDVRKGDVVVAQGTRLAPTISACWRVLGGLRSQFIDACGSLSCRPVMS